MGKSDCNRAITVAHPHTILKFELINEYIKAWAPKLMNNSYCHTLVYIDCMCNSGIYKNEAGEQIKGTAILVAETLAQVAKKYKNKKVEIYFNDIDSRKIELLKRNLPANFSNFEIDVQNMDMKEYLAEIGPQLYNKSNMHYFLLYDPYKANIEWEELVPFLKNWGEVLINHMVSDTIRALGTVKKEEAKEKYEHTYLADFLHLLPFGSDKKAYQNRILQIIEAIKGNQRYYVGTFPIFNRKNAQVYDLIHCTNNIEGFKLYKKCAWKVFGGKSSDKNGIKGNMVQLELDFDGESVNSVQLDTDEDCFKISDIADFIYKKYKGKGIVPIAEVWHSLETHPVFPSEGFRNEIKEELLSFYNVKKERNSDPLTGKKVEALIFE